MHFYKHNSATDGALMLLFTCLCVFTYRNGSSNDPCDKPGHGHVLGNLPLEPDGDNGETWCGQRSNIIRDTRGRL